MEWFISSVYIPIEEYNDITRVNVINRIKANMRNDLAKVKERTWRVTTKEYTITDLESDLEYALGLGAKAVHISVKVKGRVN